MTVQDAERLQEQLEPKEDLSPYAGQWVALREGRIIDHDLDPAQLRDRVEPDDDIIPVPRKDDGFYIL